MPNTVFPFSVGVPDETQIPLIKVAAAVGATNERIVLLLIVRFNVEWVLAIPISAQVVLAVPVLDDEVNKLLIKLLFMFTTLVEPLCDKIPVKAAIVPVFTTLILIMESLFNVTLPVVVVLIPMNRPLLFDNMDSAILLLPIRLLFITYTEDVPCANMPVRVNVLVVLVKLKF